MNYKKTAFVIVDMWDLHWCKNFNGKIKNKKEPKIAIEASVKPISKNLFICLKV